MVQLVQALEPVRSSSTLFLFCSYAKPRLYSRTWTRKQQDVDADETEQTQNTQVLREGQCAGAREKANENKGICPI